MEDLLRFQWEAYTENDFTQLRRDWDTWYTQTRRTTHQPQLLARVYSTTRDAAIDPTTYASSISTSTMSLGGSSPVRLCSFEGFERHADRAHLCPKTGPMGKVLEQCRSRLSVHPYCRRTHLKISLSQ
jgi:hypothetical protein